MQGMPEAPFLFGMIINMLLYKLQVKWRSEGRGVAFGRFDGEDLSWEMWWDEFGSLFEKYDLQNLWLSSLAFLDDITLFATSVNDLQMMIEDVHIELRKLGLSLNLSKVKWIANKFVTSRDEVWVEVDGTRIFKSSTINFLGSMIHEDLLEGPAVTHRVQAAWLCYHKWSHIWSPKPVWGVACILGNALSCLLCFGGCRRQGPKTQKRS